MKPRSLFRSLVALAAIIIANGCAYDRDLELLEDPTDEVAERERVRRLMDARVLDNDLVPPSYIEVSSGSIVTQLVVQCREALPSCATYPSGNGCDNAICNVETYLCLGHSFLEISGLREAPFQIRTSSENWDVPAQSSATNVAFLQQALTQAAYALRDANKELSSAAGLGGGGTCTLTGSSGLDQMEGARNRARVFAASFVEAYHLHTEANQAAVTAELAVADSAFSSTPGLARASGRAIGGNDLSRSAAAHLLVGGDEGLEGAVLGSFCTSPEHTAQVQAAIEVFREAAISPTDLLNPMLSIESLLASEAGPIGGSVRHRLGELWARADLAAESDAADVAALFSLRIDDFVAARAYLVEEFRAFARTTTGALEARELAGGGSTSYARYAGTASDPAAPPDAFYAALARYTATPDNTAYYGPGVSHLPVPGSYNGRNRAFFTDAAVSNAARLVSNPMAFGSLASDALDPLAMLISDGSRARTARIRFCRSPSASTYSVDMQVNGYSGTDGVRVVVGEDGLRCAVDGSVEGAPCTIASHTYEVFANKDLESHGFNSATYRVSNRTTGDIADRTRLYVVVPRAPSTAGMPGGYHVLAGFYYREAATPYCTLVSVVPDAESRAADALRPNEDHCARSSVICAGESYDARLPLEDELSSSGGEDLEDSWRHYLALARAAADEADLRGEELIAAGLENDYRSEGAVEELLDICGAGIDPTDLIDPTLSDVRPSVACTSDANCTATGPEYRCRGGQCVLDAVALVATSNDIPARNRLMECLGDDSTRDFVTLGTQPVCIWRDSEDPNRICQGQDPMAPKQCPVPAIGESESAAIACAHLVPPAGHERVLVTTTLAYFDSEAQTAVTTADPPCAALRRLRQNPGEGPDLDELVGSNFFRPYNVSQIAPRISWEARFGGFSTITIDGVPKFATGTTWEGAQTSAWPCAGAGLPECASGAEGLFCDHETCTNPDSRALINDRMLRAVLASRVIADIWPEGLVLPIRVSDPVEYATGNPWGDQLYATPFTSRERWDLNVLRYGTIAGEPDPRYFPFESGTNWRDSTVEAWRSPVGQGSSSTIAYYNEPDGGDIVVGAVRPHPHAPDVWPPPAYYSNFYISGVELWGWNEARNGRRDPLRGLWTGAVGPGWFRQVLSGAPHPDVPPGSRAVSLATGEDEGSEYWHASLVPPFTPTSDNLLDGLELLCQVSTEAAGSACNIMSPPEVVTAEDLPEARRYLGCVATEIERRGALSVFTGMPVRALDALRQESLTGAFPATGGLVSVQVSQLRSALIDVAEAAPLLAAEIRMLSADMEELRIALALGNIREDMADIQFMSTVSNQLAACGSSGTAWGAASTCANSLAQIVFTSVLHDLEGEAGDLERELSVIEFRRRFESRATNFQSLALRLTEAAESIDATLAEIERLRSRARRALAKALFLDSDAGSGQYAVNSAMRARLNTRRTRYSNAHRNAVRMAFLAKRAVEQRLGIHLSQMTEDFPLVPAPATWEASVCASTGIDYSAISSGETTNFTDAYIGDYVDKLESVVESYRLVHAFHEGTDTAVVSVRDDVMNVRAMCASEVPNLLYQSGCLNCLASDEAAGWRVLNCNTDEGVPLDDCVHPFPLDDETGPFPVDHPDLSAARPFEVVFGRRNGSWCSGSCGLRSDSELSQVVELPAGRYRLSWYGRMGTTLFPQDAVQIEMASLSGTVAQSGTDQADASGGWKRYWRYFDLPATLPADEAVRIAIRTYASGSDGYPAIVQLAAFMLEDVSESVGGALTSIPGTLRPRVYAGTGETLTRELAVCEDTTGEVFRQTRWRRECVRLCASGYAAECDGPAAQTACFWEASFNINQRDIEAGHMLRSSGFARGNFNYRIESVALNFVGSGTRNCADDALPSTCTSAGFIPYSLVHEGPYMIRNHVGQDYRAHLFTARVEHARGLASERYVTNPVSSADAALIGPYTRREFMGRPLDGSFVIRVWDEPGVNFDAIEDVQVVLNYRYWTRFE